MSAYAFARRGARVGICVLALGAAGAAAQQGQGENSTVNPTQSAAPAAPEAGSVKPAEPAASSATEPAPGTSTLPELVVDAPKKKEKKEKKAAAKAKDKEATSVPAADSAATTAPPPGVVLGTSAPSDTGTTSFDARNVQLRSNGGGDANSFLRNLPNVQYQNQADRTPGVTTQKLIDTKPQLLSISGGRTYENNFIVNGVSISNITGPIDGGSSLSDSTANPPVNQINGLHPQNIFIPTEFVGEAKVIDSNASAEYGQFLGGVVVYDLAAPPTDRYHASVSASRHTSEMVNYILATPDGKNTSNRKQPTFEKNNLSVSLGAPITRDFSFIVQASRKEAETSSQKVAYISDESATQNSDNIFFRFAATARTDVGSFTFDTSWTDYFQHWENIYGRNLYIDTTTKGSSNKLEYKTDLAGIRVDEIGLGRVKLTGRAYYNDSETRNSSGGNTLFNWVNQKFVLTYDALWNVTGAIYDPAQDTKLHDGWCRGIADPLTYKGAYGNTISCLEGGYGNQIQGQTDLGVQASVNGDLLLGSFNVGGEVKQVEGRRARLEDFYNMRSSRLAGTITTPGFPGKFDCGTFALCDQEQYANAYDITPKYDISKTVNAIHTFAEVDQTWQWLNVRAGVRLDYDDYMKNVNLAPRLAATVRPFEGIRVTGGVNRYYLGETLYYAIRDGLPGGVYGRDSYRVTNNADGTLNVPDHPSSSLGSYSYRVSGLATPYDDEYTGAVNIVDPLLGGQWRVKYLQRYGKDQFATTPCGSNCYATTNDGVRSFRSATAEYTKQWNNLRTPFYLDAAAIGGNVTWSEQTTSRNSYLNGADEDLNGDGILDNPIWYNRASYRPSNFKAVTGNLDIPVRFGATLSTLWFDDLLELNVSAGVNLGYNGVAFTGTSRQPDSSGKLVAHDVYEDKAFNPTLKLDLSGRVNVTEQAAIEFNFENLTNSKQNAVTTAAAPWVIGRSFWVGSALRF